MAPGLLTRMTLFWKPLKDISVALADQNDHKAGRWVLFGGVAVLVFGQMVGECRRGQVSFRL